jgi:EAL domain-containing protein (putative c-di-GMP-specific phosphodiesterase class I)
LFLKSIGCKFSLDDFGSGLSSFSYLKNLPVDYLKIDGGFIRNIEHDQMDMEFVKSINQIGHTLGVETIAEFIENQHTAEILERLGVDFGQGFHIMEPKPFENLLSATVIPIRSGIQT